MAFVLYLFMCFMCLIQSVIKGIQIKYGDEFNRKMYLFDPEHNRFETVSDDGTYVIHNGTIVGRQDLETAKMVEKMNVKMHWEPKVTYICRFVMMIFGVLIIFMLMFTLVVMMVYIVTLLSLRTSGRDEQTEVLTREQRNKQAVQDVLKNG